MSIYTQEQFIPNPLHNLEMYQKMDKCLSEKLDATECLTRVPCGLFKGIADEKNVDIHKLFKI